MYNDDQPRDDHGMWTSFLGAHSKLDKLAANAHAKAESVKPPNWQVTPVGKKYVVHKDTETSGVSYKNKLDAERNRNALERVHRERQSDFHRERTSRASSARNYLHGRSQRDVKYGKQLKLPF